MSGLDKIPHSRGDALIAEYKERYGDKTLIAFSRGKDSIAVALGLRDKIEMIPFYYDDIPGLEFIDESLDYYERKLFGRKILRLPHPVFYKHFSNGLFQPMRRAQILAAASIPRLDHKDVVEMVKQQEGIEGTILSATGIRALDNAIRFMSIRKHGAIRPTVGNWAPIWDWTKGRLMDEIEKSGVSLPPDYTFLPRSLDGFSYLYLIPLKERFPRDFERICDWLPLARAELLRCEINQRLTSPDAPA
ncbi:hypothetical protein HAP48_0042555 [Bradyrhizobium septentrionale]|uniref:Phosphoadenosine phosphosulfate reductase n=1 Tax=Bradyrhizobium septentrionale TaxID=1404411 RepID=A0A974A371_9BRAD|nr:hypothetical protein [Bradyrhizobium septentrionale]UGY15141.1 hypothetical protein HAP48_0042555 [Bradyrhizobium septentrionale]